MDKVNAITRFFAELFVNSEKSRREKGQSTLLSIFDSTAESLRADGCPEENIEDNAEMVCVMAVMARMASNLQDVIKVIADTGKILVEIRNPELVTEAGHKLMTESERRKAIAKSVEQLTGMLSTLTGMLQAVNEDVDDRHIVDVVLAEARKAKAAQPEVKAKPVTGSVTPFERRTNPSAN